jgi:3-hydroxyisobutyrate dehydrogenase-like beta-hydroxyacid dehydrogenase
MQIALLGLGKTGIPISGWLRKSGHPLTVWNRTPTAGSASTAAEAVKGKSIVFTALSDDTATAAVTFDEGGILQAMEPGAMHVSLSTISVALSRRLGEAHQQQGQHFVGAPVFGRPPVAELGKLWIVVGGAATAVERVRPLLETFSRGLTVVSDQPWRAHALKLGGNFMIAAMIQAISEATIFAEAQGLDRDLFLETVNSALFQSALYAAYSQVILHPPPVPGSTVAIGSKDVGLFRAAAAAEKRHLPLADYIALQLHRAQESGMNAEEWAVGQYRITDSIARSVEASNTRFDIG